MTKIVGIKPSPLETKRYRVTMDDGKQYDFGLRTGSTYLDHHDKNKRDAYMKRHLGNATEKHRIHNLIPSAALFSAYLLWGRYTSLQKNVHHLNGLFAKH